MGWRLLSRQRDHGPLPPKRSGVIRMTWPGGGCGMGGNFTPGPMYTSARRCSSSGPPPGTIRARPWTTRYSSRPIASRRSVSIDNTTRGFRSRFWTLRFLGSDAATISPASTPTQTHETCGLPSGLSVTIWARRFDSSTARAESGIAVTTKTVSLSWQLSPGLAPTGPLLPLRQPRLAQHRHPRLAQVAVHHPLDVRVA